MITFTTACQVLDTLNVDMSLGYGHFHIKQEGEWCMDFGTEKFVCWSRLCQQCLCWIIIP